MNASEAFVPEKDINKVMRLKKFGFGLRVAPVVGGYWVKIVVDPRR